MFTPLCLSVCLSVSVSARRGRGIDRQRHTVLQASHPSPLGAYAKNEPFMQSRCFSRCNEALVRMGQEPVDWTVPK